MRNKTTLILLLIVISLHFTNYQSIHAQQKNSQTLQKQVSELEKKVGDLEKRIEQLESRPSQVSQDKSLIKNINKQTWRQLRNGMTTEDIRELFGEPDKVDGGTYTTTWWYKSGRSIGYISFDEHKRVTSWSEPN
jgi:TolA-binding protein